MRFHKVGVVISWVLLASIISASGLYTPASYAVVPSLHLEETGQDVTISNYRVTIVAKVKLFLPRRKINPAKCEPLFSHQEFCDVIHHTRDTNGNTTKILDSIQESYFGTIPDRIQDELNSGCTEKCFFVSHKRSGRESRSAPESSPEHDTMFEEHLARISSEPELAKDNILQGVDDTMSVLVPSVFEMIFEQQKSISKLDGLKRSIIDEMTENELLSMQLPAFTADLDAIQLAINGKIPMAWVPVGLLEELLSRIFRKLPSNWQPAFKSIDHYYRHKVVSKVQFKFGNAYLFISVPVHQDEVKYRILRPVPVPSTSFSNICELDITDKYILEKSGWGETEYLQVHADFFKDCFSNGICDLSKYSHALHAQNGCFRKMTTQELFSFDDSQCPIRCSSHSSPVIKVINNGRKVIVAGQHRVELSEKNKLKLSQDMHFRHGLALYTLNCNSEININGYKIRGPANCTNEVETQLIGIPTFTMRKIGIAFEYVDHSASDHFSLVPLVKKTVKKKLALLDLFKMVTLGLLTLSASVWIHKTKKEELEKCEEIHRMLMELRDKRLITTA